MKFTLNLSESTRKGIIYTYEAVDSGKAGLIHFGCC